MTGRFAPGVWAGLRSKIPPAARSQAADNRQGEGSGSSGKKDFRFCAGIWKPRHFYRGRGMSLSISRRRRCRGNLGTRVCCGFPSSAGRAPNRRPRGPDAAIGPAERHYHNEPRISPKFCRKRRVLRLRTAKMCVYTFTDCRAGPEFLGAVRGLDGYWFTSCLVLTVRAGGKNG
jgi:hypothetical protein